MNDPPVRGQVLMLNSPIPNYGQIVILGCPSHM